MHILKNSTRLVVSLGILTALVSCKEDLDYLETNLIDGHNFEGVIDNLTTVVAYSRRTNPVQTNGIAVADNEPFDKPNGLPVNMLGFYNNPVYGITHANVLSQVTLNNANPTFGDNPTVEKVMLHLPYFSTATTTTNSEGVETTTYELDSVFGSTPMKLTLYESGYYLRNLDPDTGFQERQKYYSDQEDVFESFLGQALYANKSFVPSNEAIVLDSNNNGEEEEEEHLSPRLYVELNKDFFQQKIVDQAGRPELQNNNNFREYFRGIYFKVEPTTKKGTNWVIFDLGEAKIELTYTHDGTPEEGSNETPRDTTTVDLLSFGGIRVNTLRTEMPAHISSVLDKPNTAVGEANLYLKGGDGAVAVIDLFGEDIDDDGVPDELEDLRKKNILINNAFLDFYVNQDEISGGSHEPERIFLYDMKNNNILRDYVNDGFTDINNPSFYRSGHLGRLERDESGKGIRYRVRVTDYINDLVNKDSTNYRLGVGVSSHVGITTYRSVKESPDLPFEKIPTGSVISQRGTVLYGSGAPDENKRLKLYIYYTEVVDQ